MELKIFVSVGRASSQEQKESTKIILNTLKSAGMSPRLMFQNEWTHENPLRGIRRVMKECDGIVIIAYTRWIFPQGRELSIDGDRNVDDVRLPTVWNQIEAGMGYMNELPILVIGEKGLLAHGLIESQADWNVFWTSLEPDELRSDAFQGWISSWKRAVESHHSFREMNTGGKDVDLKNMTLGQLFGLLKQLSVPALWTLLTTIFGALVAIASIAYKVGGGKWPWG